MSTLLIMLLFLMIVKEAASRNESIPFVKLNSDTSPYLSLSIYIIAISSIKVLYTRVHCLAKFIPESNLLLISGLIIGFIFSRIKVYFPHKSYEMFQIKSDTFFYILLPPIILEASFSIYHKTFASNLAGVFVFAILATLLNFFTIAIVLNLLLEYHYMDLLENEKVDSSTIWIFSSLIVAVDPVAVLGIFQEIHVDYNLYYLVFGESLLNDGVSVVLYEVMMEMSSFEVITAVDVVRAIISFLLVGIGGGAIGCGISVITCLVTRFTVKTPIVEPIVVLTFGYLSYLLANTISWSGIISMIAYGVIQAAYGFQNITTKSLILVKRLSKILSSLSESVIFLNLGVTVTSKTINWTSTFLLWSTFLCLYSRFVFTLALSGIINYFNFNIRKIQWNEQFIIAYGGLRGGIAFCLSELIHAETNANKQLISQTTVFIILFTIFIMGFTMKPLVKMLNIEIAKPDELCLFVQVTESAIEHLLAAVEEIIGMKGRNAINEFFANIDELYIRPFLQRDRRGRDEKIMKVFEKMNLTMHMATTAAGTPLSEYYLHKLKPQLRQYMFDNRPDFGAPIGVSTITNNVTTEEITDYSQPSKGVLEQRNSFDNALFFPKRQASLDPTTLAHHMSAMLNRRRRSLAVTNAKTTQSKYVSKTSRLTLDSETDMMTLWRKDFKH